MIRSADDATAARYQAIGINNIERTAQWQLLEPDLREAVQVVSTVLPFRTNAYVMAELIDWQRVPDDPMYQLTFPQYGMLSPDDYALMSDLLNKGASKDRITNEANRIRSTLNPHPAGQMTHNVPSYNEEPLAGVQHKYRETVLFFPSHGQTCHAYCTFCFRWAQFVGREDLRFANREVAQLSAYLEDHPEVTDVLFTGGDPMIMSTKNLSEYIEPLLEAGLDHVRDIRIGTKSVAYWPQRFVTDKDADDCLRLFEKIVKAGKHLSIMGHCSHPVELSTSMAREALRRIRSTGAQIRMQSPIVRYVNDNAEVWAELWRTGVHLGLIPYYMFVERDTGARNYFQLPLVVVSKIFRQAYRQVSGLARTARGPSMSTTPGKVCIHGSNQLGKDKILVMEYLQARDPSLVGRPFFAKFNAKATWWTQLEPAREMDREFFPHYAPGNLSMQIFKQAAI